MSRLPAILLVDDDDDYLFVARRAIERTGLKAEVRVARAGEQGLRLLGLESREPPPDGASPFAVVLLDLRIQGMSGQDVLRRMQGCERTRLIPVVVVSSSDRPDEVRECYELGANSYVVKRFMAAQPGAYVAEAARYWIELNEPPPAAVATGERPEPLI